MTKLVKSFPFLLFISGLISGIVSQTGIFGIIFPGLLMGLALWMELKNFTTKKGIFSLSIFGYILAYFVTIFPSMVASIDSAFSMGHHSGEVSTVVAISAFISGYIGAFLLGKGFKSANKESLSKISLVGGMLGIVLGILFSKYALIVTFADINLKSSLITAATFIIWQMSIGIMLKRAISNNTSSILPSQNFAPQV